MNVSKLFQLNAISYITIETTNYKNNKLLNSIL